MSNRVSQDTFSGNMDATSPAKASISHYPIVYIRTCRCLTVLIMRCLFSLRAEFALASVLVDSNVSTPYSFDGNSGSNGSHLID